METTKTKPDVYEVGIEVKTYHRYFVVATSEDAAKRLAVDSHFYGKDTDEVAWAETVDPEYCDLDRSVTAQVDYEWWTPEDDDAPHEDRPVIIKIKADYNHAERRGDGNAYYRASDLTIIDENGEEWHPGL